MVISQYILPITISLASAFLWHYQKGNVRYILMSSGRTNFTDNLIFLFLSYIDKRKSSPESTFPDPKIKLQP